MGFVYKITNTINGKIYIGQTENADPYKRFEEHLKEYKRPRCKNRPLYSAMNECGVENFKFEVIEECEDTKIREIYWINFYRTFIGYHDCNGYNATLGGDGKAFLNLDADQVIDYHINQAEYIAGRTAKYFGVDRKTIKDFLTKHNIKYLTEEEYYDYQKQHSIKICQIDVNTNELINIFNSMSDASEYLNKNRDCRAISNVLHNRNKTAYGFRWMYYEDYIKIYGEDSLTA